MTTYLSEKKKLLFQCLSNKTYTVHIFIHVHDACIYWLIIKKKKNRKNLGKTGLAVYMENFKLASNLGIDIVIACTKSIFLTFPKG